MSLAHGYVVCGSRDWPEDGFWLVADKMLELIPPGALVITGGARGVDDFAHRLAVQRGHETRVMRANWGRYGKRAGFLRNVAMIDQQPAAVLAFCIGSSQGTMHTIRVAQGRGIPVHWFKEDDLQQ